MIEKMKTYFTQFNTFLLKEAPYLSRWRVLEIAAASFSFSLILWIILLFVKQNDLDYLMLSRVISVLKILRVVLIFGFVLWILSLSNQDYAYITFREILAIIILYPLVLLILMAPLITVQARLSKILEKKETKTTIYEEIIKVNQFLKDHEQKFGIQSINVYVPDSTTHRLFKESIFVEEEEINHILQKYGLFNQREEITLQKLSDLENFYSLAISALQKSYFNYLFYFVLLILLQPFIFIKRKTFLLILVYYLPILITIVLLSSGSEYGIIKYSKEYQDSIFTLVFLVFLLIFFIYLFAHRVLRSLYLKKRTRSTLSTISYFYVVVNALILVVYISLSFDSEINLLICYLINSALFIAFLRIYRKVLTYPETSGFSTKIFNWSRVFSIQNRWEERIGRNFPLLYSINPISSLISFMGITIAIVCFYYILSVFLPISSTVFRVTLIIINLFILYYILSKHRRINLGTYLVKSSVLEKSVFFSFLFIFGGFVTLLTPYYLSSELSGKIEHYLSGIPPEGSEIVKDYLIICEGDYYLNFPDKQNIKIPDYLNEKAKKFQLDFIDSINNIGNERGFLGTMLFNYKDEEYSDNLVIGVQLDSFRKNSFLPEIGVEEGDVVLGVNGVEVISGNDLIQKLRPFHPGDRVYLSLYRPSSKVYFKRKVPLISRIKFEGEKKVIKRKLIGYYNSLWKYKFIDTVPAIDTIFRYRDNILDYDASFPSKRDSMFTILHARLKNPFSSFGNPVRKNHYKESALGYEKEFVAIDFIIFVLMINMMVFIFWSNICYYKINPVLYYPATVLLALILLSSTGNKTLDFLFIDANRNFLIFNYLSIYSIIVLTLGWASLNIRSRSWGYFLHIINFIFVNLFIITPLNYNRSVFRNLGIDSPVLFNLVVLLFTISSLLLIWSVFYHIGEAIIHRIKRKT